MIGIVTVTYNSASVLRDFLDSLAAQTKPFTLYVVDNDSTDATLEVLRAEDRQWIRVLPQTANLGIAVGNNVGIRNAIADGCEWVLLLNNDTAFGPALLDDLVTAAVESSASVVVPSIRYFDSPDEVWYEAARFARWRGSVPVATPPASAASRVPIECACTCCALVHSSAFIDVGLMDERFFVYWDDTDFFYRCHAAGIAMTLDPGIKVLHKVSSLTGGGESTFSQFQRIKNRVVFIRKHHGGVREACGIVMTAFNVVRLVVGGDGKRERAGNLVRAMREGMAIPMRHPRAELKP